MPSIYEMEHTPEVERVLEEMRTRLAKQFGVTVTGNRCTVRWNMDGQLVDVHMIIENVTTPEEGEEQDERGERFKALIEKYRRKFPDLEEEILYAETGEHSQ